MKNLLAVAMLFLFSSCGSISLSPTGCRSAGFWGEEEGPGKDRREIKISKEYYVWNVDNEVRIKDFLKEKGINCSDVKSIRVEIESVFFVTRKVSIYVTK